MIALVACSKSKMITRAPASMLYQGQLFQAAKSYIKTVGRQWFILSAQHGLVHPSQTLEPYNFSLYQMTKPERVGWAGKVIGQMEDRGLDPESIQWELLAGRMYREPLVPFLPCHTTPLTGLGYALQVKRLQELERIAWTKEIGRETP